MSYVFNVDTCWYKDSCEALNTPDCENGCLRHLEMFHLFSQSGLPVSMQKIHKLTPYSKDVQAFKRLKEIQLNILDFVKEGNNLYLYSQNFGNGKTTWAVKFMQSYFNSIWFGNRYRQRSVFIHVPTFMVKLRNNINNPTQEFNDLKTSIDTLDLIVWDDIGGGNMKEYDYIHFLSYIDTRIFNGKSNIYTSNLDVDQLTAYTSGKLVSRIYNNSEKINLIGPDRRNNN